MEFLKIALLILIVILLVILIIRDLRTNAKVNVLESYRETDSTMLKQLRQDFDNREARFASMVDRSLEKAMTPVIARLKSQDGSIAEIRDMVETLVNRGTDEHTPPPPSRSQTS